MKNYDIIIIGAGPAGTCCAAMLKELGHSVVIIEKNTFPRFSIGESLLPQNMELYKEAGLLSIFEDCDFQFKDGAQFLREDIFKDIDFSKKSTDGASTTYQVRRSSFDKKVTDHLQTLGVDILFDHTLEGVEFNDSQNPVKVSVSSKTSTFEFQGKFLVDASGLAKVLPKALNLKTEYQAQDRRCYFSHIKTSQKPAFDTNKILISVDQTNSKCWFWTIPLAENNFSLGVITDEKDLDLSNQQMLEHCIERNPLLKKALGDYEYELETKKIQSFTSKTQQMFGENFLLIGNSGEFLDPIFSSGITIALKSACLASPLINKKIKGESVDFDKEYLDELNYGLKTFKVFVDAWYGGDLQDIIFTDKIQKEIRSHIISVLAGYAWDKKNPYTQKSERRLKALAEVCRG